MMAFEEQNVAIEPSSNLQAMMYQAQYE